VAVVVWNGEFVVVKPNQPTKYGIGPLHE